jgi:hypothetical protein
MHTLRMCTGSTCEQRVCAKLQNLLRTVSVVEELCAFEEEGKMSASTLWPIVRFIPGLWGGGGIFVDSIYSFDKQYLIIYHQ